MDDEQFRTARRMRLMLYSLLAATVVLAVVDLIVMATKNNTRQGLVFNLSSVIYQLNSLIFFIITIGLVVSTMVVTKRIKKSKTLKRQVIKDRCAMYAMTIIFTLSYLLRTMFLISQIWLAPVCDGGFNPKTAYIDEMLFLALLPIFDTIPIFVVLVYHLLTLRHVKEYVKASPDSS